MSWDSEPPEDRDLIERGVGYELKFALIAVALTLLAVVLGLS